ncbi:sugar ABC transporter permease [Mesorhizobium loti]|nr:sugar ABC transporter permease [Mesorhizobium loti]
MLMIELTLSLIRREVVGRYRGSILGLFWSFLTPLFMLAVYTFVFGYVLKTRWSIPGGDTVEHSTAEFAVILFAGLIPFQYFSEVVSSSPALIVSNANYVKKIVFPIHILPVVSAGAAVFHSAVSLVVLVGFAAIMFGAPWTAIMAPVVFAPLVVMTLGFAWILAAIGVYFRDIGQIVPPLLTATMFLSPLFFPRTNLPAWLQPYLSLNPIAVPIEALRDIAVFGTMPDWAAIGYYTLVAIVVALLGEQFFRKTSRGFADVL